MKIIEVDNFNRDTHSDVLIVEKVSKKHAKMVTDALNAKDSGFDSPVYFRYVSDDYKLYIWEP